MKTNKIHSALLYCSVATIYYLAASLGLALAFEQANTSPVWPPTGISIAAVLYFGNRVWPGIFIGALLINLTANSPLLLATLIAIGNTLEALVAGYLISRYAGRYPFSHISHTALFVLFTLLSTMVSATVGVSSLFIHGIATPDNYLLLWKTWWLGDVVGGLVITPFLLTWCRKSDIRYTLQHLLHAVALITLTLLITTLIFTKLISNTNNSHLLIFALLPILSWSAIRFQHHGATLMVFVLSATAIAGTLNGYGPFVMATENESLLLLQASVGTAMITALILAASMNERIQANHRLKLAQHELESQVSLRTEELSATNTQLQTEITRQILSSKAVKALLHAADSASNEAFFESCAIELSEAYKARYAFIGIYSNDSKTSIKTLAVSDNAQIINNVQYQLEGTPCQDILNMHRALILNNTAHNYPKDELLQQMHIDSFFGTPLKNSSGEILGIIAVMDTQPIIIEEWAQPILGLFSNHIAMELQRRNAQKELELADNVFKESIDAIVICSADTRILRTNPAFTRITGYSSKDVIGLTATFLQPKTYSADFYQVFQTSLTENGVWQGEIRDRRKNGESFPSWHTITVLRDHFGEIQQYISIFSDITDKKLSEEHIYNLAHNDMLTQLPNRVAFHNQITTELEHAKRADTQLAVMFIDLDHFKLINDTLGHPAGDELLQQVAYRLKNAIRKNDTISRFGGDEFTILLPNIRSENEASMVARKIQQCLLAPIQLNNHEITITASIGIGIHPQNGREAATLLKNADSAMYRTKDLGRDGFQFFTEEMNQHAHERLELERELRKALERNDFVLHYQPQVNAYTGSIVGVEALIRWVHPDKGIIQPNTFIPIAEASGLITPIGEWVLNTACKQHKEWQDQGYSPFTMAVNLSGRQFKHHNLLPTIQKAINNSGIIASELELELTESIMMENVNDTISTLSAIRELGVQLSIDDFGTGYSSMAYLKRFPINKLKIDRSFVRDLPDDSDDAAIVKATIALAHALNLTVIAEGVETKEQLQFLKDQQCEEIQGYLFSRPLPAHELTSLLDKGSFIPALSP